MELYVLIYLYFNNEGILQVLLPCWWKQFSTATQIKKWKTLSNSILDDSNSISNEDKVVLFS